ncbi:VCBS repeat-containing protein [Dokdonella sp.]|uniref:FG-GAP repeat domain-containing protein n=1 Tax=Dokdonella sp. TaxID=2291710 RepID=UPI001AFFF2CA|nr:VCBS repeat-containing protein [Dokdonella sp.]MBO9662078.1 VCBS repeat-containing protein [Dokdonella sp.]
MKFPAGSAAALALIPFLFGSVPAQAGAAAPDFAPAAMHLPNCCFAVSLTAADLNGDGAPDLITGNMMSGDFSVLLSDGAGGYAEPVSTPITNEPARTVKTAIADLNGDGKLDLVVAGYHETEIRVYPGDGAGGFGDPTLLDVGSGIWPTALALADIDGDGRLDIVTANGESATVAVLVGDGAGGFAAAVNSPSGAWATGIAIADFDGDGHLDVATANAGTRDASILFGDGSGQFATPQAVSIGPESEPNAITVADVDGDGKPDLLVASSATGGQDFPPPELPGTVSLLINDGSGGFAPAQVLSAGSGDGRAHDVAFADVTGDGKPDILLARPNANAVSILAGDGAGGFAPATNRRVAQGPYALLVVDVTGDGSDDVLAANAVSPSLSILPTDGAGGIGFSANFDSGEFPHAVAAGDLNHDGHPDIVSANAFGDDVSVLLGDGSGGFAEAVHYPTGSSPTGVALGDVNGDGHLDIVSANFGASSVSVLLGNGDGSFAAAATFGVGGSWESPYAVALGDANGDGKLDIATANTNISNESLSFLAGNGDGSFATGVVLRAGEAGALRDPRGIAFADVTGDGKADIVSANSYSSDVSILAGDGAGGFADAVHFATDLGPVGVEARDVDGDGKIDLVTLNTTAQSISVLRGDGSGNYAKARNYPIYPEQSIQDYMPWPWAMTMADVNGDGKPDVVTANTQNDTVSVLLNDGRGGYDNYAWFDTGALPGGVAVADFDGDGKPDIVSSNRENKNVSVLFNRGEFSDSLFADGFDAAL